MGTFCFRGQPTVRIAVFSDPIIDLIKLAPAQPGEDVLVKDKIRSFSTDL